MDAQYWIRTLGLRRHPEGGYFKETYRAQEVIPKTGLPSRFSGPRHVSTAVYFLLARNEYSRFHRLQADELWHFHTGGTLVLHLFSPDKKY
ncbi:cupin domain-containing protein, partial [candidate division FCPU426 bacterium]|nr:cupin domain-containing protein [candidate division FCPU426 bacterium]